MDAIGILFEQASSRGHLQESIHGELDFPFTIRNQLRTSFSTLEAAREMKDDLLAYQSASFQNALAEAARDPVRAYVFGDVGDRTRLREFVDRLLRHRIEVRRLARAVKADGRSYHPASSFVVPVDQRQYRLVKSLFQTITEFPDNTFYDVSSWTLPLSFDIPYSGLDADAFDAALVGEPLREAPSATGTRPAADDAYAWVFEWHEYLAPRAARRLLDAGARAMVATRPFTANTTSGPREFDYGTIVVPRGNQTLDAEQLNGILAAIAAEDGVDVHAALTGLTPGGIDLGSPSMRPLEAPRPVLLVGSGVSSYEAGEVWHLLDQRYDMRLSMCETRSFGRLDLDRYTHVLMVGGGYSELDEGDRERLKSWVSSGGVLVAVKSATSWAASHVLPKDGDGKSKDEKDDHVESRVSYADYEAQRAETLVSGTIFEAHIDRTHPLGYGYRGAKLPVFRNHTTIMKPSSDPFANVVQYTAEPLLSGFCSDRNEKRIANSAVVIANRVGRGAVIRMVDNPNFRGVWYGTNKLYANSLFFGGIIKNTRRIATEESEVDGHGHDHGLEKDH